MHENLIVNISFYEFVNNLFVCAVNATNKKKMQKFYTKMNNKPFALVKHCRINWLLILMVNNQLWNHSIFIVICYHKIHGYPKLKTKKKLYNQLIDVLFEKYNRQITANRNTKQKHN